MARRLQSLFPHDYEPGIARKVPGSLTPVDFAEGRWFIDDMAGSINTVGGILPAGFEAYVRLPHPYWRDVPEGTDGAIFDPSDSSPEGVWTKSVRGAEATIPDEAGLWPPIEGVMGAPTVMSAVTEELRAETGNVTCLCGFWKRGEPSGRGHLAYVADSATVAQFLTGLVRPFWWVQTMFDLAGQSQQAARSPEEIVIYRGRLDDIRRWISEFAAMMTYCPLPTALWPEDRSWCIALPQNKSFSFVAGSRELMRRILALPEIDAFEAKLSDNVWDDT